MSKPLMNLYQLKIVIITESKTQEREREIVAMFSTGVSAHQSWL